MAAAVTEVKSKCVEVELNSTKIAIVTSKLGRIGKHFDAASQALLLNGGLLEPLMRYADRGNFKPTAKNYEGDHVDISGLSSEQVIRGVSKGDFVVDGFVVKDREEGEVQEFYNEVVTGVLGSKGSKGLEDLEFIVPPSSSYNFHQL